MVPPEYSRTVLSFWKLSQAENIFSLVSFRHGQTMKEISCFVSFHEPPNNSPSFFQKTPAPQKSVFSMVSASVCPHAANL